MEEAVVRGARGGGIPVQRFCGETHLCVRGQQGSVFDWSGGKVFVCVSFMVFETESRVAQDSFEVVT